MLPKMIICKTICTSVLPRVHNLSIGITTYYIYIPVYRTQENFDGGKIGEL